jgi:hypothetical protein
MKELDHINIFCDMILKEINSEEKANKHLLKEYSKDFGTLLAKMNVNQFNDDMILFTQIRSHYRNLFNALNLLITISEIDITNAEGQMMYSAYSKQFNFYKEKFLEKTFN